MNEFELRHIVAVLSNQCHVRYWVKWGDTAYEPLQHSRMALSVLIEDAELVDDIDTSLCRQGFAREQPWQGHEDMPVWSVHRDTVCGARKGV